MSFTAVALTSTPLLKAPTRERNPPPCFLPQGAPPDSGPIDPERFARLLQGVVNRDILSTAPMVFDFDTIRLDGITPLCLAHERPVLGLVERVSHKDGLLIASGVLDRILPSSNLIAESALLGFKWGVSIGVDIGDCDVEEVPAGRAVEVNGQTIAGPTAVVRAWRLGELSVVLDPADPSASLIVHRPTGYLPWRRDLATLMAPDVPADSPAFRDRRGRVCRIVKDQHSEELTSTAARVSLPGLVEDVAYREAIVGDRESLVAAIYCNTVGPNGRRLTMGFHAFRDALADDAIFAAARTAFLALHVGITPEPARCSA